MTAQGSITATIPVVVGQVLDIRFGYKSRGMNVWTYQPTSSVARLRDFELDMRTHFHGIDFPAHSRSPSARERTGDGYRLRWKFDQVVSGFGIGMTVPSRIQPGELAAELAYSAPVCPCLMERSTRAGGPACNACSPVEFSATASDAAGSSALRAALAISRG